ncbi:MAG TPA: hypothetical protein VH268_09120, partial [Solirubrobacterales bacterium]|nr:hypothetical protein [Solirubrobacterales bacterium]
MAIALAVVLTLVLVDAARAGTYRVAQCGWGVGTELDPTYPATEGSAFSLNPAACAPPPGLSPGMRFEGSVAPNGVLGLARARWIAPSGTRFSAAHLTWSGSQQPGNWQALAVDIGGAFHLLAYGLGITAPTPVDLPIDGQAWAFEALVQCIFDGPVAACTRSTASTMRLSDLTFTLEDQQPPQARLAGPLLAPGWRRGTAALELGAEDVGAGVAGEAATIDGAPILGAAPTCAVQTIEGEVRGTKMQPCPPTATRSVEVDTTRLADGVHTVHACATDFAGDGGCAPDAEIEVDNSPPEIAFDDADEGQVAATVSDRYSGPASGTISVRRADAEAWTDLPTGLDRDGARAATLTARLPDLSAGTYLFRAVAADGAGNTGSTQLRVSGSAAEVRRKAADGQSGGGPAGRGGQSAARRATRLTAHLAASGQAGRAAGLTVDYGTAVELVGRLSGAHGAGVAGRPVVVVARPAAGIGGAPER